MLSNSHQASSTQESPTQDKKIPVTILTGFLGSGKTTLLNRILSENHGKRIAVIENEFGEIGIDHQLVLNSDEEIFEMNNGC
ncbi:MAG: CobW family GTP-binding protein, partial [Pseudobdellovibrionaceae bacterium]